MIFHSVLEMKQQITKVLDRYPNLQTISETSDEIVLAGEIKIARIFNDYPVIKTVSLEITIPFSDNRFPHIKDIGECIDPEYPHRYVSGILCLATEIDFKLHFMNGFDLVKWMEDFVEPYYYSYEYFQRFGHYPFGDREHGYMGTLQSYCDWFESQKIEVISSILLRIESTDCYRGHHSCFCGSKKKMRDCHGRKILPFYEHRNLRMQLITDLNNLRKELENERNCRASK